MLPLIEEYQIAALKQNCEEYLLAEPASLHLLYISQTYDFHQLLNRCLHYAKHISYIQLKDDPFFDKLSPEYRLRVLLLRVQDLEEQLLQAKKIISERETRMFGCFGDLASGFGNFCAECKSRKVSESCTNCLKMFRDRVKAKYDELKNYRQQNPLNFGNEPDT